VVFCIGLCMRVGFLFVFYICVGFMIVLVVGLYCMCSGLFVSLFVLGLVDTFCFGRVFYYVGLVYYYFALVWWLFFGVCSGLRCWFCFSLCGCCCGVCFVLLVVCFAFVWWVSI